MVVVYFGGSARPAKLISVDINSFGNTNNNNEVSLQNILNYYKIRLIENGRSTPFISHITDNIDKVLDDSQKKIWLDGKKIINNVVGGEESTETILVYL